MKNKKLQYVLIPLVVLLWGLIFYKIFTGTGKKENVQMKVSHTVKKQETMKETFSIAANYRDPFLNIVERKPRVQENTVSKSNINKRFGIQRNKPRIQWPVIEYKGMIVNNKLNQTEFMLTIGNDEVILNNSQEHSNVTLIRGTVDSVYLNYQGELKTFAKGVKTNESNRRR